jgi:hypothetical protein
MKTIERKRAVFQVQIMGIKKRKMRLSFILLIALVAEWQTQQT